MHPSLFSSLRLGCQEVCSCRTRRRSTLIVYYFLLNFSAMTIFSSCHLHFGHISQPFHSLCQYLPQISPRMTWHKCQICYGPNIARFTRVRSVHLNLSGRAVREILSH